MSERDPVIELVMPSFLMPPLEMRHGDRVSEDVLAPMARVTTRAWFPRRTIRLRALRNVYVAEEGLVIHHNLALEQASVRGHDEGNIARARDAIVRGRGDGTIPRADGDVVLCRSHGAWNYGHWLVEMLPMAYVAAHHWPRPARFLLQAVTGHLRDVMRDAYDRLGIPAGLRIEQGIAPIFVERLIVVEGLTDHGNYIAPLVMDCLDRLASGIAQDRNEKLFVSRGKALTRVLPREATLAQRLMSRGFVCLAPGSVSLAAQVAAFKGAKRIVGVIGAAMTNLVFAPRGSEAVMIAPSTMPDTFFWFICGLRGIRLIDVRCLTTPSTIGNPHWDGPLDVGQQDEDEIVAAADAPDSSPADNGFPGGLFDAAYYRASYGADIAPDEDPLEHFFRKGWRKGYDPSAHFSTSFYLDAYPDVRASGANPLAHYIAHGMTERRLPLDFPAKSRTPQ